MNTQKTRFWMGIVMAILLTVGAIFAAFAKDFPYVAFATGIGGIYGIFAGSKMVTDKFCDCHNGGADVKTT